MTGMSLEVNVSLVGGLMSLTGGRLEVPFDVRSHVAVRPNV